MTTAILSDYLESALLNHVLRNTPYTSPGTSIYVALHTANPLDAGSGAQVAYTNYARVQATAWDAPSNRATQNTNAIAFPTPGSDGDAPVTHIGIWDALTAGNLLLYGALNTAKSIFNGVPFSLAAGAVDFAFTGGISTYLAHALINHVLRNTAYASPGTSIYASLHTATLTVAMTETEVSGNGYARVQVTAWDAPGATDGHTQNTNIISFPTPTGAWGTITDTGIRDASTAGNGLFFSVNGASISPTTDDVVQHDAGALDVTLS